LDIGSSPRLAAELSSRESYERGARNPLTRSGPITHDFVQEAQAVALVNQEQENTKKPNPRTTGDVKVQPVSTLDDREL